MVHERVTPFYSFSNLPGASRFAGKSFEAANDLDADSFVVDPSLSFDHSMEQSFEQSIAKSDATTNENLVDVHAKAERMRLHLADLDLTNLDSQSPPIAQMPRAPSQGPTTDEWQRMKDIQEHALDNMLTWLSQSSLKERHGASDENRSGLEDAAVDVWIARSRLGLNDEDLIVSSRTPADQPGLFPDELGYGYNSARARPPRHRLPKPALPQLQKHCGCGRQLNQCLDSSEIPEQCKFEDNMSWEERQRVTGVIARLVVYLPGEDPGTDFALEGGRGSPFVVTSVQASGPACAARVKAGDRLVQINGNRNLMFMSVEELTSSSLMRAPARFVFTGFVGKVRAELRISHTESLWGVRHQEVVDGHAPHYLCEEKIFDVGAASLLLAVTNGKHDGKSENVCPLSMLELSQRDARVCVRNAVAHPTVQHSAQRGETVGPNPQRNRGIKKSGTTKRSGSLCIPATPKVGRLQTPRSPHTPRFCIPHTPRTQLCGPYTPRP